MKPKWSTALPDWESCIAEGGSLIPCAPLFMDEADEAIEVFKQLKIVDAPGSPTIGEACAPWVIDFAKAIFGSYDSESGKRLIQEFFLLISKKNSKALCLDTLIPTPTGWTTMGQLQAGDQVFGVDGKPCNVIATSDVFHDHKCYELTFSNGQKVVADAGHLWKTSSLKDGKEKVRTTQEIADTLFRNDGARNHSMLMPSAIECAEVELTVPPYTLGNRLPRSRSVHITSAVEVKSVHVKCISVDSEDNQFLFGETMLPTHNSTIAAGIMLTLLIRNWRQSAELIILAPTIEVAQNAYKPARDMVKHDEDLSALFNVQDHTRTITHRGTGATLKVVAADANTVSGKKASVVLIDELHQFGKMGQAENMLREATGGLASRPEGCIIYLTTQSDQPPAGVFLQKLQYARGVRDGKIDDKSFMPVLYEFPRKMIDKLEHLKPENFKMTNPNLGYSVSQDYLERELMKAQEAGEESLRGFLSKFLNVEIGLALLSNRWTGAEFWERQARDKVTLDYILDHSEVITVGIDGGGLDDLLGMAVVGRCSTTRSWLVWCRAWAHPSVLERRKSEAARLHDFSKQGDLSLVQNIGQDVLEIAEIVKNIDDTGLLDRVGVDPAGIGAILDAIVESGVDQEKVVGVSQGWRLGGAIKTTERKLAEGGIIHANQPIMNWCCGNARVEPRGNSILITKQASGTAKIDPLIALFCAISLMATNPAATQKKYQMFVL